MSPCYWGFYLHSSPLPPSNHYLLSQVTMAAKNLVDWGARFEWRNCTTSWGHRHCSLNLCQASLEPWTKTSEPQDVGLYYFHLVKVLDAAILVLNVTFCKVEAVLLVLKLENNMQLLSHSRLFFIHTFLHTPFILLHHTQFKKKTGNKTDFPALRLWLLNPPAPFQIVLHHISFSPHPPCQLSQPRTRAAVCQVWIDAMLAELSSWPVLDVMQIFSLDWGSRDQSECELCNNSDGRHWQVFGLGGIWPAPDPGKIPPVKSLSASQAFCS